MLCEKCKKNKATVFYEENINGKKRSYSLCEDCAAELQKSGDVYHKPAVVADTHCIRICGRLGFYPETLKDPQKVEFIMRDIIEPAEQSDFCHRIVMFGRDTCTARSPKCDVCRLRGICAKQENMNKI